MLERGHVVVPSLDALGVQQPGGANETSHTSHEAGIHACQGQTRGGVGIVRSPGHMKRRQACRIPRPPRGARGRLLACPRKWLCLMGHTDKRGLLTQSNASGSSKRPVDKARAAPSPCAKLRMAGRRKRQLWGPKRSLLLSCPAGAGQANGSRQIRNLRAMSFHANAWTCTHRLARLLRGPGRSS